MSPHISYHPLGTDTIRRYVSYMSSQDPAGLAAVHYDGAGAHDRFRQPFIDMASVAPSMSGMFDTGHGVNLAATQGFFGQFHYVHDARLSELSTLLLPYRKTWQELLPTWPATDSAVNELGNQASSGVFIAAEHVGQLMNDVHDKPELQAALAQEFPGEKLNVLWTALAQAHEMGFALLEASGVIEPNPHNITQSRCRTNQTNCEPAGLRLFLAAAQVQPPSPLAGTTPDAVSPSAPPKVPGAPSLAERLRQRSNEPEPPSAW